jgi:LDH2 family malate/lactate/ureidoglycolate dehydrogenase
MIKVNSNKLITFIQNVYKSVGVPAEDANFVADTLVQADLWGHQSHGVLRAPWYFERLVNKVMSPTPKMEIIRDKAAITVIDGNHSVGQVVAKNAMEIAIEKSKQYGVSSVAIKNSNHFGTLMFFTQMAAKNGCIAFLTSNGGPAMAPWGGAKKKIIGTNPWSISAPAGKHTPIMMDMANTGIARGKIYLAKQRREKIPLGWALDADGAPTTDPEAAINGIILPMAQHKGYAIATVMDVLAGVLPGGSFLSAVNGPYHYDKLSGVGHFVTVYDIDAFIDKAEYDDRVNKFINEIKSNPLAKDVAEIFYPGEMEARSSINKTENGLELPEDTWTDLLTLAQRTNNLDSYNACIL